MQHLLVYALDRKLTGSIVLETPEGERSAFSVKDGVPTKAKTAEPVIHLGRLLLEKGKIDEATLNRTLARVAKDKVLHGKALLEENAIDEPTLADALREQLSRKVLWMATLPAATMYGFYEALDFLERWGGPPVPVEPLALIWRAIRSYETDERVQATLARIPAADLRLHPDAQVTRFGFSPREQVVIDLLRAKAQPLRALIESEVTDERSIQRVIYALAVTRHLELGADAKPIGVSASLRDSESRRATPRKARRFNTGARRTPLEPVPGEPTSAAPPSPRAHAGEAPEHAAFRREILERARSIPGENYYQILGVPPDAEASAIQTAFFQLAKRWHPDRLPPELADVREVAMRSFARMSEAHQILADEERRTEYDELLKEGGGTSEEQEQVQVVMRAIHSYQKAEVLLKKRNLAEAEVLAKKALDDDPSQADYLALYAWILSQKPERANAPVDDLLEMLNEAVRREPANERARFYRAQLLKRAGRADEALKDFRFIVEHNPKHLDAVREIRLYDMRKSQVPGPDSGRGSQKPPGGGLFGKLFKR